MIDLRRRIDACRNLEDAELLDSLAAGVAREREDLVGVLLHIAEVDSRDLAKKRGYSNLFEYCVGALRYSEGAAMRRIKVARAGRDHHDLLRRLARGELHLAGAAMLAQHLTAENRRHVLDAAGHKTQDQIATIVASLAPGRRRKDSIRLVSAPHIEPAPPAPASVAAVQDSAPPLEPFALSLESVANMASSDELLRRISFDACQDTFDMIQRAREILRHRFPRGDLNDVLRTALAEFLDREDRDRRRGRGRKAWEIAGVAGGRYVHEWVKQAVWERDGGRCSCKGEGGHVCGSRDWLEFDHIVPVALGGRSTIGNVRLLCRAHNQLESRRVFGGPDPASVRARPEAGQGGNGQGVPPLPPA